MYDEFIKKLKELMDKFDCFPIKIYKITENIFYVDYFDRKHDCTNFCHFGFEDGLVKQIKLEQIK
jgi:hypothetical protein